MSRRRRRRRQATGYTSRLATGYTHVTTDTATGYRLHTRHSRLQATPTSRLTQEPATGYIHVPADRGADYRLHTRHNGCAPDSVGYTQVTTGYTYLRHSRLHKRHIRLHTSQPATHNRIHHSRQRSRLQACTCTYTSIIYYT